MDPQPRRIAIAGIAHETNTYCREETQATEFGQRRGAAILRAEGTQTSIGGAVDACRALGVEPVPILAVGAQPSGTISREAYEGFRNEIVEGIVARFPLDGVYLDLHGAGVVAGLPDLEGDLAVAVRDAVGEAVPVTASFDLHGNVSQRMADALDGVFACHQYPHVDMHERAIEAVGLINQMLDEDFRPVVHVETLPLLLPTTTTFEGIGESFLAEVLAAEAPADIIDVSWFHGFPYTDTEYVGSHIVVTTRGERAQAEETAADLAASLWRQRELFRPASLSAAEAVAAALAAFEEVGGPVVINETSDNCGGGTPGDGTHLLRAMLDAGLQKATFAFIVDPAVAAQAHEAGVGATIQVALGAKYDTMHGTPIEREVYVKALHDGRLTMQAMGKGAPLNLGPLARLVVDGIDVVVGSHRSQTFDPGPFEAVGISVMDYPIVALKSSNHVRAGFGEIASRIVTADPPGLTTHHVEVFDRKHKPAPMWPIDDEADYPGD